MAQSSFRMQALPALPTNRAGRLQVDSVGGAGRERSRGIAAPTARKLFQNSPWVTPPIIERRTRSGKPPSLLFRPGHRWNSTVNVTAPGRRHRVRHRTWQTRAGLSAGRVLCHSQGASVNAPLPRSVTPCFRDRPQGRTSENGWPTLAPCRHFPAEVPLVPEQSAQRREMGLPPTFLARLPPGIHQPAATSRTRPAT